MKKLILILMILSMIASTLLLPSCACEHTWSMATCIAPKTCSKCGATEGTVSGHTTRQGKCEFCGTFFNELADEVTIIVKAFDTINTKVEDLRYLCFVYGTSTTASAYSRPFTTIVQAFVRAQIVVNEYPHDFSYLVLPLKDLEKQITYTTNNLEGRISTIVRILEEFCDYYNGSENWYSKQYQPAIKKYYNQQE